MVATLYLVRDDEDLVRDVGDIAKFTRSSMISAKLVAVMAR